MWFNSVNNYEMNDEDIRSLIEDITYDNNEYYLLEELMK